MDIKKFIASGVLEMYVLGQATELECAEVEKVVGQHPEIKAELTAIEIALEQYDLQHAITPHATVKPGIHSVIDYTERLEAGEPMTFPPILNENSKIEDFQEWISRPDMQPPAEFENIFGKIIGATTEATTLIIWIKKLAPEEVHNNEHERFLILEGTCTIRVGTANNYFKAGDYFQIPLHMDHEVIVTSDIPCKVIMQRVAA
jgi:mannose-6-phosphate isomerase-like protein (cupin superfamily)